MAEELGEREDRRETDCSLVAGYLAGEPQAFDEVDRWLRFELRSRWGGLRDEHEDIALTVHGKLYVNLKNGRFSGGSSLRRYVTRIAQHTTIDWLRKVYRSRDLADDLRKRTDTTVSTTPYEAIHDRDELRLMQRAFQAVPEACRALWRLLFVKRLSYEQMAQKTVVPVGTIKSRLWHCRRKAMDALRRLRLRAGE